MKASEARELLSELIEKHGDLELVTEEDSTFHRCDWKGELTITYNECDVPPEIMDMEGVDTSDWECRECSRKFFVIGEVDE